MYFTTRYSCNDASLYLCREFKGNFSPDVTYGTQRYTVMGESDGIKSQIQNIKWRRFRQLFSSCSTPGKNTNRHKTITFKIAQTKMVRFQNLDLISCSKSKFDHHATFDFTHDDPISKVTTGAYAIIVLHSQKIFHAIRRDLCT